MVGAYIDDRCEWQLSGRNLAGEHLSCRLPRPGRRLRAAYFADAQALGNATDIAVAGVDVTGIDAVLRLAGAVTGIYSDTTTPLHLYRDRALVSGDGAGQNIARSRSRPPDPTR